MNPPITATHVYRYLLCEHTATLAFHGDPARSVAPHEGLRLLLELGNRHEASWVAEHCADWATPSYPERDWAAGLAATLDLMRSGVSGVLQGVLIDVDRVGKPDLLRREEGPSDLGDHHYIAGDVKSSAEPHTEQVMQVLFYARLLELLQGRLPSYGYLIMADGREERFDVTSLLPIFDEVLREIRQIRDSGRQTKLHLSHQCGACGWRVFCRDLAQEKKDLSLIPGVGRGTADLLRQTGIATVRDLATLSLEQGRKLAEAEVLGIEVLGPLRRRARAVERGEPTILSAPEVPPPPEGIYVVASSDPRRNGGAFLYAILEIDRSGKERRETLYAKTPAEERELWHRFLERITASKKGNRRERFSGIPIFHSGGLAPATVEAIQSAHGGDPIAFERVHDEGVDLSRMLLRSIAVPTPSASLRAYTSFSGGVGADGEGIGAGQPGGSGFEARYGGPFGHYYPWHERFTATGDEAWRRKILAAAELEIEALRSLRLRLHEAAKRAERKPATTTRGRRTRNGTR
ncbi:MAG: hypothetical protein CME06_00940 [Gemmatimonadetes bacterium]|nr:hypothetical protein [Gemmatimonadota bacterium]